MPELVEWAALEMRCVGNCTGGSNPSLSADKGMSAIKIIVREANQLLIKFFIMQLKNMQKILLLTLIAMTIFTSCKKDKDPSLEGKWIFESLTSNYYVDNVFDHGETTPWEGGTFDFQTNGKLVTSQIDPSLGDTVTATQPYTILPDSKVSIGRDTMEIRNLTASRHTL